jgi:hypothetical protein
MKRVMVALAAMVCVAGCKYREKEQPDPKEVLPSNVWEFENHFYVNTDPGNPYNCAVPHYLVFNKDRSGYYTYEHPCDSSGPDTLRFTWSISTDKLYVRMILNKAEFVENKFIICDYDMVRMDARTWSYTYLQKPFHMIDGNYRPKSN